MSPGSDSSGDNIDFAAVKTLIHGDQKWSEGQHAFQDEPFDAEAASLRHPHT